MTDKQKGQGLDSKELWIALILGAGCEWVLPDVMNMLIISWLILQSAKGRAWVSWLGRFVEGQARKKEAEDKGHKRTKSFMFDMAQTLMKSVQKATEQERP